MEITLSLSYVIIKGEKRSSRKGCWRWHLWEHIHNNLMQLGGPLGNVPQKIKKLVKKTRYISDC
jgi:hypothetical protein